MKNVLAILVLSALAICGCEVFTSHGGEGQPCFIDTGECKPGLMCVDGTCIAGQSDAGTDGGADAGGDEAQDAGTDAGVDAGEDAGGDNCKPEAYQQCGVDGNVYWYDDCGQVGEVADDCHDTNAECIDTSGTEAHCSCLSHWTGEDCTECPGNWDPSAACNVCLDGWQDIEGDDCGTCVRYVDMNAPPSGSGLTWATAFQTIQGGIYAAEGAVPEQDGPERCQVWVKAGTYNPTVGTGDYATITLISKVDLYGGFSDTAESWAERDWENHKAILDGNGVLHVVTGANDAVLDGFTITGGHAVTGEVGDDLGGGMKNADVSPDVRNCTFLGNFAKAGGGGLANLGAASPVVTDCIFRENYTEVSGGAISNSGSGTISITGCSFIDNYSRHTSGAGDGGAMHNGPDTTVTIDGCSFTGNNAVESGGAIVNNGADLTVNESIFNGNYVPTSGSSYGGALSLIASSRAQIFKCFFIGNTVTDNGRGGAIYVNDSDLLLRNSVLTQNAVEPAADGFGGGLYSNSSSTTVINCTFYNNTVDAYDIDGGAIYFSGGSSNVVYNTIVWGNTPNGVGTASGTGATISFSDNQDGTGPQEYSNISQDPRFVGGTPYDLHLEEDSPCINRADRTDAPEDDIEGTDRPVGEAFDMGAYECY